MMSSAKMECMDCLVLNIERCLGAYNCTFFALYYRENLRYETREKARDGVK